MKTLARVARRIANRLARAGWLLWFLFGCGGPAFEQASPAGAELAGAPSGAVDPGAGGSVLLSGAAGGAGGDVAAGNEAGNSAGGDSAPGGAAAVLGGAAGDAPPHACDVSHWTAQAFRSREAAASPAAALDGSTDTRWTSGVAQEAGQWFALELGAGVTLSALELRAAPDDMPAALRLELDGRETAAELETLGPGVLRVSFAPTAATSARLELTGSAPAWWSIAELGGRCL